MGSPVLFRLVLCPSPPARGFSWNSVPSPGMAISKETSALTMSPEMHFSMHWFINVKPRAQPILLSVVISEFKLSR